jgi:hypothetical protein
MQCITEVEATHTATQAQICSPYESLLMLAPHDASSAHLTFTTFE